VSGFSLFSVKMKTGTDKNDIGFNVLIYRDLRNRRTGTKPPQY